MDFFASTRALEWASAKRKEQYAEAGAGAAAQPFKLFSLAGLVSFAVGLLIGLSAIYLSWTCNTAMDYGKWTKVFWAGMAYWFGLVYLVNYVFMRSDTCSYIKRARA